MMKRVRHIGAAFFAAFLILALATYHPTDCFLEKKCLLKAPHNAAGWLGAHLSHVMYLFFGLSAWLIPIVILDVLRRYTTTAKSFSSTYLLGWFGLILLCAIIADLFVNPSVVALGTLHAGGVIGAFFAYQGPWIFGSYGLICVLIALFSLSLSLLTSLSLYTVFMGSLKSLWSVLYTILFALTFKSSQKEDKVQTSPILKDIAFPVEKNASFDDQIDTHLQEMGKKIISKLKEYGISSKIQDIRPGPVLIRFECLLAAGERSQKVAALAQDLARGLKVERLSVVHNIPGKPTIAIEIPQEKRESIPFYPLLSAIPKSYCLPLALGVDSQGQPVIVDLASLPHLLVAGATGSGKSVAMNVMLMSLMSSLGPDRLKCVLIDPKILEFALYQNRAHLAIPVVTESKHAIAVLYWCVDEMQKRYNILAQKGFQHIRDYHKSSPAAQSEMPYWVIIVDELADLMLMTKKAAEEPIARLAQKARACGIHLILATQRPSVDVITGLIKANIPARISFAVSSKIDSRTILDSSGAEDLLGMGDSYFLRPNGQNLLRLHGAFISDAQRKEWIDQLSSKVSSYPNSIDEIVRRYNSDIFDEDS